MTTKTEVAVKTSTPVAVAYRVELLFEQAGSRIAPLGVAPLPSGPVVLPQPEPARWDWLVLRVEDDPLFVTRELDMPWRVKRHVNAIDRSGARFDAMFLAHEIPRGHGEKGHVTVERAAALIETIPKTVKRSEKAADAVLTGLKCGLIGALVAPALAAAAPLALVGAMVSDPVLIGVVSPSGKALPGEPSALFVLARW